MENIEQEFYRYLEFTTEESRREDETFIELQLRYSELLMELELKELGAIYGDTSEEDE